ncbi:MAG: DUF3097 domain-containing protein [Nostocoides sp.]
MTDRYGSDVLSGDWRRPAAGAAVSVPAELGLVIEDVDTGWCGAITAVETVGGMRMVHVEDRHGRSRAFPLGPGFLLEGNPVVLTAAPTAVNEALARARADQQRTASGSTAVHGQRAKVAAASRIFVEGRHDAELVEKVWGDDLRVEGIVVEMLDGVDDLAGAIRDFGPGPGRRMGVLVDHLVPDSKESRIVAGASHLYPEHVLIVGHPFVDVWQSVRPDRLGMTAWPGVPRTVEWKRGICEHLGWPHTDQADLARAWKRILACVRTYADLEPTLLGRVEELIDFVTSD